MYEDVAGIVLRVTLLLITVACLELWVRWRTRGATAGNEAHSSGSYGAPVVVHAEGLLRNRPQEVRADEIQPTPQWSRNGESKVTFGGCSTTAKEAQLRPFAEIFFRLNCIMTGRHTSVQLGVDQVDFGVGNCCIENCSARSQQCGKNCKTDFIHKVEIQVCPKSWAQHCHRLLLQPHPMAEVFGLQRSSTFNFQVPLVLAQQASVSYQTGNTVCYTAPAFRWIPAWKDGASNSVSWAWELHRYANGRKLEFNRLIWGSRPLLGITPSYMQFPPGSFHAKASWELQPNAELLQQRLEWDVKVSLHTAILHTKRWLPSHSVTTGPTLTFEKLLEFA